MAIHTDASGASPEWYSRQEAADLLAVSESAIRKWEREGKLRSRKAADGTVSVEGAQVRAMLEGGDRDPLVLRTMAHLETIMRSRLAVIDDLRVVIGEQREEAKHKALRIGELEKMVSELHQREAETLKAVEALFTEKQARELELAQFEREQGRRDRALEEFTPLAKSLMARLGSGKGKGKAAGDAAPVLHAMAAFRDSLSGDQAVRLEQVLTPEQRASLVLLFDALPGGEKDPPASVQTSGQTPTAAPAGGGQ